jgi:HEAT repeat protein
MQRRYDQLIRLVNRRAFQPVLRTVLRSVDIFQLAAIHQEAKSSDWSHRVSAAKRSYFILCDALKAKTLAEFLDDPHPDVVAAAFRSSRSFSTDARRAAFLQQAWTHPSPLVRRLAVGAVAGIRSEGVRGRLLTSRVHDADPVVRLEAVGACLALKKAKVALSTLKAFEADPDPAVRQLVTMAMRHMQKPSGAAMAQLKSLYAALRSRVGLPPA